MKALLFSITLVLCFAQYPFASACDDSLYLELKKKDINKLTQNEMTYRLAKDRKPTANGVFTEVLS